MPQKHFINFKEFKAGAFLSLPICAGYFAVSFALGITAREAGINAPLAALMSFTNLASAGQFAGITLIASQAAFFETFLTILVINMRYGLMSLTLTQKLAPGTGTVKRLLIAYGNTDEIFGVSSTRKEPITGSFMAGLEIFPILSWTAGTFIGSDAGNILSERLLSALGIALFGMFVSIVVPPATKHRPTAVVALFSMGLSLILFYVPFFAENISSGFRVIICTLTAAFVGALFFPTPEEKKEGDQNA